MVFALALALTGAACHRAPTVRGCGDDLTGLWRSPAGDYQLLEGRAGRSLYPLYPELPADLPAGVLAAPAVIELPRGDGATGTVVRRYERGAQFCRMTGRARLIACGTSSLTLELAPPPPPGDWEHCTGAAGPTLGLTLTR